MMTVAQVDPIALRQKLKKLGIGAEFPLSPSFAEDAVQSTIQWAEHPEPIPCGITPRGLPALRLEPVELAYCLDAWSRLWEVPA
jgi:hypothetical protein